MQNWSGQNYIGKRFDEYFILYSQNRDSGILDQSNFRSIEKYFKENKLDYLKISFNHWAVGWIENIMILESNKESVDIGNVIEQQLKDYPIFNDQDFSDLESDKAYELLQEIRKDISNLDVDEDLIGWNEFNKTMTDDEILDQIYASDILRV